MSERRDRRASARRPKALKAAYRVVGETLIDPLKDLSAGGAFLHTRTPLPLGSALELFIDDGDEDHLVLDARVVRVVWGGRDKGDVIEPGMALAFVAPSATQQRRLLALLERK